MTIFQDIINEVVSIYNLFLAVMPEPLKVFIGILLIVLVIGLFTIFIWKFYRFVAKKNILELNLNQYNWSAHPVAMKLTAGFFYFIEYIIILPFIVFFWFAGFTIFLVLLTENLDVQNLLTLSAVIVAVIRMTAYYSEDLSKDIAKLLPFTLLGISLINSLTGETIFNFQQILLNIGQIPTYFGEVAIFIVFIIGLEVVLRFFDFIFSLFGIEEEQFTES